MNNSIITDDVIKDLEEAHNELIKEKRQQIIALRVDAEKLNKEQSGLKYLGMTGQAIELEKQVKEAEIYFKELLSKLTNQLNK